MKRLTEAQEQAMHTMREPGYNADGTKISDNTGRALAKRNLAEWNAYENKWVLSAKGFDYVLGFIVD